MKKLSDYEGDEAIELWADLIEPLTKLLTDEEVQKIYKSGMPKLMIAKEILKAHPAEVTNILQRIDPEPINGLNISTRFVGIITDISNMPEMQSFFGVAAQGEEEQTI